MKILSHAPSGFDGTLVSVEIDIRRGIPGMDIVGLPDGAVREARERVRVALRNCGFLFPRDRILLNLAPAGIRKEGASFDLPIAAALLDASDQLPPSDPEPVMILGELELSGRVRPVRGVLSAVASGLGEGVRRFLVPERNLREACSLEEGVVAGIDALDELPRAVRDLAEGIAATNPDIWGQEEEGFIPGMMEGGTDRDVDFRDLRGQPVLKRAMEIAAAGRHNVLLFGPPGSGKTMAARRLPTILPDLERREAIEVTRIYSQAGFLGESAGLIRRPPFRMPHHSSSLEGIIGGGRTLRPGEASLAHRGVLFLDEAPEFRKGILQSLREPVEDRRVSLARAGCSAWYPADFLMILAANPCPCGNLGADDRTCMCGTQDVFRYWRRLGGPLLDRIDIRVPVRPARKDLLLGEEGQSSAQMRAAVDRAAGIQHERYTDRPYSWNSGIPPGEIGTFCPVSRNIAELLSRAARQLSLSSRAVHAVLRVARTAADLSGSSDITEEHVLEAVQHRRYGDGDLFWDTLE